MLLRRHPATAASSTPAVPWFVAPFGRDSIIVCLETLMLDTRRARSTACGSSPACRGAPTTPSARRSPARSCTSCAAASSPRSRRSRTRPTTARSTRPPLYLLLVCEVVMWTGDLEFFELLREPIEAALRWIDEYGDFDGDGFVEYRRRSRAGSRRTRAGATPATPSCTRRQPGRGPHRPGRVAGLRVLRQAPPGEPLRAARRRRALRAPARPNRRPSSCASTSASGWTTRATWRWPWTARSARCRRSCSTVGHCLWSRILADEHVPAVVERLLAPEMFSGWGVRTMSQEAAAYSPMSLYNGSVWPFDNALIVNGLKKHGFAGGQPSGRRHVRRRPGPARRAPARVHAAASRARPSTGRCPTPWPARRTRRSAGAPFLMLQAMLGLYAQRRRERALRAQPAAAQVARRGHPVQPERGPLHAAACASGATATAPPSRCATSRAACASSSWSDGRGALRHRPRLRLPRRLALLRAQPHGPRRGRAERAQARRGGGHRRPHQRGLQAGVPGGQGLPRPPRVPARAGHPGQPRLAQRGLRALRAALRPARRGAAHRRHLDRGRRLDRARPRLRHDRPLALRLARGAVRPAGRAFASSCCTTTCCPSPAPAASATWSTTPATRSRCCSAAT